MISATRTECNVVLIQNIVICSLIQAFFSQNLNDLSCVKLIHTFSLNYFEYKRLNTC